MNQSEKTSCPPHSTLPSVSPKYLPFSYNHYLSDEPIWKHFHRYTQPQGIIVYMLIWLQPFLNMWFYSSIRKYHVFPLWISAKGYQFGSSHVLRCRGKWVTKKSPQLLVPHTIILAESLFQPEFQTRGSIVNIGDSTWNAATFPPQPVVSQSVLLS